MKKNFWKRTWFFDNNRRIVWLCALKAGTVAYSNYFKSRLRVAGQNERDSECRDSRFDAQAVVPVLNCLTDLQGRPAPNCAIMVEAVVPIVFNYCDLAHSCPPEWRFNERFDLNGWIFTGYGLRPGVSLMVTPRLFSQEKPEKEHCERQLRKLYFGRVWLSLNCLRIAAVRSSSSYMHTLNFRQLWFKF